MVNFGKVGALAKKAYSATKSKIDKVGPYLNKEKSLGVEAASNALKMIAFWAYYEIAKPDIVLGIIPLFTVQNVEVSRSHDILKYRAVRGEFMAHQKGGNVAMRIDFTLTGEQQGLTLAALQYLHYYGVAESKSNALYPTAFGNITEVLPVGLLDATTGKPRLTATNPAESMDGNISSVELNENKNAGNNTYYEPNDYSYLEQKVHKTFTVYTRDEVLFDMYIETLIYSRNIKEGPQNIHGTILLRHFIKPNVLENVGYRKVQGTVLESTKTGYNIKTDATVDLVQEVKYKKGIQDDLGRVNLGLSITHQAYMSSKRYGINALMKTTIRSNIIERTQTSAFPESIRTSKTVPVMSERSASVGTSSKPDVSHRNVDVKGLTPYYALNISNNQNETYYVSDNTIIWKSMISTLYYKYMRVLVDTISSTNSIVNITYNNGSKECVCAIKMDDYNVTINDDGTTYTLRFINGNKYTLTIGNGKTAKLYFEVGLQTTIYRLV